MSEPRNRKDTDWVSGWRSNALAWGLPVAALVGARFLPDLPRTIIWTGALAWMGGACLLNARRCGRTHCFFTGPFFLLMAVASFLHGFGIASLGPSGWRWIGMTTLVGGAALWFGTELAWGKYTQRNQKGAQP